MLFISEILPKMMPIFFQKIDLKSYWNRLFEGAYIGVCCLRCSKCKIAWKVEVDGDKIKMTPQNCSEPEDTQPE